MPPAPESLDDLFAQLPVPFRLEYDGTVYRLWQGYQPSQGWYGREQDRSLRKLVEKVIYLNSGQTA